MDWGHVKISRKAYAEDPLWNEKRRFSKWEAWEDMIQMSAWKPYLKVTSKYTVRLNRGEFPGSLRFLAKRWMWGIQKVRTFLEWLEKYKRISTQRETQAGTVYLLVNYDSYQIGEVPHNTPDNTPVTHRQHTDNTNKKQLKQLSNTTTSGNGRGSGVDEVVKFYLETHPRRRVVDGVGRRKIRARLDGGFTVEDLKRAITGQANDPWCIDKNKMGLDWSLRDADHINDYIAKSEQKSTKRATENLPLLVSNE